VRKQVARWVQQQRSAPAPTGPKKYRHTREAEPQTAGENATTNAAAATALALAAPRRLVWLRLGSSAEFDAAERTTFSRIQQHAQVARASELAQEFQAMLRPRRPARLDAWRAAGLERGILERQSFATGLQHEYASMLHGAQRAVEHGAGGGPDNARQAAQAPDVWAREV
jgi:hypothetical protein